VADAAAPLAGCTALYGGSFDPPHMGHQMACLYLLEALGAAEVWLVPTATHAFGKALSPYPVRRAMCAAMMAPFGGRVQLCDVEQRRGGVSRSIETLGELQAAHPERRLAMVVGADVVPQLPRWHAFAELMAACPWVVLGRGGTPEAPGLGALAQDQAGVEARVIEAPLVLPEVSSSALRTAVAARGPAALWGLVPAAVQALVAQHELYAAIPARR
jgi:nicotinate-nucleotide adenylyltransferase